MKHLSPSRIGACVLVAMVALVFAPSPSDASQLFQGDNPRAQADALFQDGFTLFENGEFQKTFSKGETALPIYEAAGERERIVSA